MLSNIEKLELKLKVKKMDTHRDEMEIQKLKLLEKVDKLDAEITLADSQIEELKQKLNIQGE